MVQLIDAEFAADDAAYLKSKLDVYAELYSDAELQPIVNAIFARLPRGVGASGGVSCKHSPYRRAEIELYKDSTAEQRTEVAAIVAEYGDRALLHISEFGPPALKSMPIFVADFVRRQCKSQLVLRVRNRSRSLVKSVTVGGRKLPLRGELRLPIDRRPRVKVVLKNGRSARQLIGCD